MKLASSVPVVVGLCVSLLASCDDEKCGPTELVSGSFEILEPAGFLEPEQIPIDLEGGNITLDLEKQSAVLRYPDGRGTVTFQITSSGIGAGGTGAGGAGGTR